MTPTTTTTTTTTTIPKWTDERETALRKFVGDEVPVSQATVAEAAESLETTTRSISSKLRKIGYGVALVATTEEKKYTSEQENTLRNFVVDNSGAFTYADIAEAFEGGNFNAKSIQGKILSMELTEHVKRAPVKEAVRKYSAEEDVRFVKMVKDGAFVEAIAKVFGRTIESVRGKALSLLRAGEIESMPKQEHTKNADKVDPFAAITNLGEMTVVAIADLLDKSPRGVKTMLTRRGLVASDYDGAKKGEKKASAA